MFPVCTEIPECRFFVANFKTGEASYFLDAAGAVTPVKLLSDNVFIPTRDGKGNMFYTSLNDRSVYSYREDGAVAVETKLATFTAATRPIAVDPNMEVIFVAVETVGIFSMNYSGGEQRVIADNKPPFPAALAVDVVTK